MFPQDHIQQYPDFENLHTKVFQSQHHTYILDEILDDHAEFRKLLMLLFNSTPYDTIDFVINFDGGCMYIAKAIIEAFRYSGIHTKAIVVGKCFSAASMITLSCDEVEFLPSGEMMVHTAQLVPMGGHTREVKRRAEFDQRTIEATLDEIYKDFLTKQELDKVKEGAELWLDSADVNARLKNWRAKAETRAARIQKARQKVLSNQ